MLEKPLTLNLLIIIGKTGKVDTERKYCFRAMVMTRDPPTAQSNLMTPVILTGFHFLSFFLSRKVVRLF